MPESGRCSESGRNLGDMGQFTPCDELGREVFAVKRRAQQMSFQCEVLPDRTEARQEGLRVLRVAKARMRRSRSRVG